MAEKDWIYFERATRCASRRYLLMFKVPVLRLCVTKDLNSSEIKSRLEKILNLGVHIRNVTGQDVAVITFLYHK